LRCRRRDRHLGGERADCPLEQGRLPRPRGAHEVERQHGAPLEPPPVALRDEVVLGENLLLEANGAGGGHRLAVAVVMVLVVVLVVLVPVAMVGVHMPVAMIVRVMVVRACVRGRGACI
jgi:hypothetical protein